LLRAGRIRRAGRLVRWENADSERPLSTQEGNIFLSRALTRRTGRNRAQIRFLAKLLGRLVAKGFRPDAVTFNILVKPVLRWKDVSSADDLRRFFDWIVLNGYPRGSLRANHLGPFGTGGQQGALPILKAVFQQLEIASLSYALHVRPLYKMFIKAFQDRGDNAAANAIVGIMKDVQQQVLEERARREDARRMGRVVAEKRRRGAV